MTHKIPAKVVAGIESQFNQELSSARGYRALSFWCEEQNFKDFAGYFEKQAAEENKHANKIASAMLDRRTLPETTAISAPKHHFKNLLEAAMHAQTMEQANTQGINAVYEAALAAKDYPAQALMHWFINEQVEEDNGAVKWSERVQSATCAGSIGDLDRHIERYLSDRVFAEPEAEK